MDYFGDLEFVCHGELSRAQSLLYRDDFNGYWGLQFSRRGRFVLKIGDNPPQYTSDACVFVSFPGMPFVYGAADDGEIENKIFVCFRGARVHRYLAGGLLEERRADALLPVADPDGFMARLRTLRTLLMLPLGSGENHARSVLALENLLLEMQTGVRHDRNRGDRRYPAFAALADRLAAQPELPWNFEREARRMAVSYAHFRRLFEQFLGMPPGAFLLAARLEKGAMLLAGGDLQIREIARECGFDDEFYFSRIFRKYRAMAPKFYRETFRNS